MGLSISKRTQAQARSDLGTRKKVRQDRWDLIESQSAYAEAQFCYTRSDGWSRLAASPRDVGARQYRDDPDLYARRSNAIEESSSTIPPTRLVQQRGWIES